MQKVLLPAIVFALFTDRRKLFNIVPFVALNWVLLAGSIILLTLSVLDGVWDATDAIRGGVVVAVLLYLILPALYFTTQQRRIRKLLYSEWQHRFNLRSYNDFEKDSSRHLKIWWLGKQAEKIRAQGEVGAYSFGRVDALKTAVATAEEHIPNTHTAWVLHMPSARNGVLQLDTAPKGSRAVAEQYLRFQLLEASSNVLHHSNVPDVQIDWVGDQVAGFTILPTSIEPVSEYQQEKFIPVARQVLKDEQGQWVFEFEHSGGVRARNSGL